MHACVMMYTGIIADKCPIEDNIDRYLIAQGIISLLYLISCGCSICAYSRDKDSCLTVSLCCGCNTIFVILTIGWTVFGSVWVWRSLDDWLHDHSLCDSVLFISAMICVLCHYITLAMLTCYCCCCCCIPKLYSQLTEYCE